VAGFELPAGGVAGVVAGVVDPCAQSLDECQPLFGFGGVQVEAGGWGGHDRVDVFD